MKYFYLLSRPTNKELTLSYHTCFMPPHWCSFLPFEWYHLHIWDCEATQHYRREAPFPSDGKEGFLEEETPWMQWGWIWWIKKHVRWDRAYSKSQSWELPKPGRPSPGWGPWHRHLHGHAAKALAPASNLLFPSLPTFGLSLSLLLICFPSVHPLFSISLTLWCDSLTGGEVLSGRCVAGRNAKRWAF